MRVIRWCCLVPVLRHFRANVFCNWGEVADYVFFALMYKISWGEVAIFFVRLACL